MSRGEPTTEQAREPVSFIPTTLIDSQFAALEPPTAAENTITVDFDKTPEPSSRISP